MVSGVTSRTESLVIVPTVPVMIPTRLAEPQVWAPTGSTASGITTGTIGRPTTGRLDTGSASGTVAVRPTGSTSSTVVVRPTSGTVRVLVRPTGSTVRVLQYKPLHRDFVRVLDFVQVLGIFVQVIRIRALYRWPCQYCIQGAEYFAQVLMRIRVWFRYCMLVGSLHWLHNTDRRHFRRDDE